MIREEWGEGVLCCVGGKVRVCAIWGVCFVMG